MRTLNPNILCRMEKYIKEYQVENGRSPSYRNIMHFMNMSSLNLVQRYVLALEREGRISLMQVMVGNSKNQFQTLQFTLTFFLPLRLIRCGEI